jgi:hypothetical protein
MSVITTPAVQDVEHQVKASVLNTLTQHLTMDPAVVAGCLDGSIADVKIASRVAIVVIARVQKIFGVKDLVDPKKLRPEQVTSVQSVADLLITKLQERFA